MDAVTTVFPNLEDIWLQSDQNDSEINSTYLTLVTSDSFYFSILDFLEKTDDNRPALEVIYISARNTGKNTQPLMQETIEIIEDLFKTYEWSLSLEFEEDTVVLSLESFTSDGEN